MNCGGAYNEKSCRIVGISRIQPNTLIQTSVLMYHASLTIGIGDYVDYLCQNLIEFLPGKFYAMFLILSKLYDWLETGLTLWMESFKMVIVLNICNSFYLQL